MIRKIQTYIEANHLLTSDKPVIVGFSGGGDSVSLLYILNRLGYKCIAAHCNFHLRKAESNRDEEFCAQFAQNHNIVFKKTDFDTKQYASEQRISIEMAARELRYNWFETLRQKYGAQAIAVAHHSDDSAETMLLNMIRGTGIRGLCGIRPKNNYVIRPLLCVGRGDLEQYLKEESLPFVTDSSNLSDEYTRNFIRLHLLPLMEEINPSVKTALSRTSEHLMDAESIYTKYIESTEKDLLHKSDNGNIRIHINDIMKQPAPKTILYELLRPYGFTRHVVDDIFRSMNGEAGKTFYAPESEFRALIDREVLIVSKRSERLSEVYKIEEGNDGLGDTEAPINITMRKAIVDGSFEISKSPATATFDYNKLKFPLTLRRWRSGDWFIPFGMKGRKKLSDYFTDHKFSLLDKDNVWILCSGEDIIWIVGERTDNRFRVDNNTKHAFIINFIGNNCNN